MTAPRHFAVIPARHGSKGFPAKNRLLLPYTLDFIHRLKMFDGVLATSDDATLLEMAAAHGCQIRLRPAELAADNSTIREAFVDLVANTPSLRPDDYLWLFYTTVVYRDPEDFRAARKLVEAENPLGVCTYIPARAHPFNVWRQDGQGRMEKYIPNDLVNRQDMPPAWQNYHYVICFKAGGLDQLNSNLLGPDIRPIFLEETKAAKLFEVDHPEELEEWRLTHPVDYRRFLATLPPGTVLPNARPATKPKVLKKALFLGLGGVGQRHLRNLLQLRPDIAVAAVRHTKRSFEIGYDLKADHSADIMDKYGITDLADLDAAIDWKPDFAVISTPTSAHVPACLRLAAAGIPIFLEKPISHSAEGLDQLVELARTVPVMVAYVLRFNPITAKLLEWVESGAMGQPYSCHIHLNSFMPSWHDYESVKDFYIGRKDLGGGVILSEIHVTDLLYAMFGLPERVWCCGGTLSNLGIDVDDTVSALFDYRVDGRPFPVTLAMSLVQRPVERTIVVHGSRGRVTWDLVKGETVLENHDAGTREVFSTPDYQRNAMFVAEMRHFVEALEQGRSPDCRLEEVVGGQYMALKMLDSLNAGQPVALS